MTQPAILRDLARLLPQTRNPCRVGVVESGEANGVGPVWSRDSQPITRGEAWT
jgi:hypothetical protein